MTTYENDCQAAERDCSDIQSQADRACAEYDEKIKGVRASCGFAITQRRADHAAMIRARAKADCDAADAALDGAHNALTETESRDAATAFAKLVSDLHAQFADRLPLYSGRGPFLSTEVGHRVLLTFGRAQIKRHPATKGALVNAIINDGLGRVVQGLSNFMRTLLAPHPSPVAIRNEASVFEVLIAEAASNPIGVENADALWDALQLPLREQRDAAIAAIHSAAVRVSDEDEAARREAVAQMRQPKRSRWERVAQSGNDSRAQLLSDIARVAYKG